MTADELSCSGRVGPPSAHGHGTKSVALTAVPAGVWTRIGPAVDEVEESLRDSGRVVLRYSGTEPLARVMVEGSDAAAVRAHAERLVQVIREELGA